jgi:CheY-like chemotaxis protein
LARTVLLADDSVTAQNMGRRILMDAGYEVVTVNNGSAALKKIHESRPDLIVLDVYMPGYGGLEVCQRLKESVETARIPVLLSVGKMEPFKAEEARRVRADGHIVKPFEASELLAALTKLEDRIVPQPESAGGRQGKSDEKSRSWRTEELGPRDVERTERVAYLSEAKKRQAHTDASNEAALPAAGDGPTAVTGATTVPSPTEAASTAATEEFAVRESNSSPRSGGGDEIAPAELHAAELVVETAAQVEVSAAETPAGEAATVEVPVVEATASAEIITEESMLADPGALADWPAATIASSAAGASRWVAENVALTVEEASVALEQEMQQARGVSAVATTETRSAAQHQVTGFDVAAAQTDQEVEAMNVNPFGAAFAAAASAAVSSQPSAISTQAVSEVAGDTASVPEAELPIPSEASAAWENWQQIREAVMSPQKAAAIAESVALMAQASVPVQEPAVKQDSTPSDNASAAPAEEDNSINDIVDSVLADLKPRLMAEIAKKLAAKK